MIIAEPSDRARIRRATFVAATLIGAVAAIVYARKGLTLSHYDARAHLVVARRVVDSLTPGWRQIGALWLPLPHLVNLIPVQWDWNYRTGASAVVLSILTLAWGLSVLPGYFARRGDSLAGAWLAAALVLLNPNMLYLQATPMTEPLLIGVCLAALAAVDAWSARLNERTVAVSVLLAAAMWVRYEAWPIVLALVVIAALARGSIRAGARLAIGPIAAVVGFLLLSKSTTGSWFVDSGFFVAQNVARGEPVEAARQFVGGLIDVAGWPTVVAGLGGAGVCVWRATRSRTWTPLLPLALGAAAILPLGAFVKGHPYRVRYALPTAMALAVLAGCALAAVPRRARTTVAIALVAVAVWANPPFSSAPIVQESQWERPYSQARQVVSAYLAAHRDGSPIMLSEGSLGHYTQELAAYGFNGRDFLHEGNGDLWAAALAHPSRYVHWILIEEEARGGDMLADRARGDSAFLAGFEQVAAGGGVVLYHATPQSGRTAER